MRTSPIIGSFPFAICLSVSYSNPCFVGFSLSTDCKLSSIEGQNFRIPFTISSAELNRINQDMDRSSSQSPEVVALLKEKIIPLAQNIDEIFSDNSLYSEAVGDFGFII